MISAILTAKHSTHKLMMCFVASLFGFVVFRVLIPSVSAFLSPCSLLCVHSPLFSLKRTNYNSLRLDTHVMGDIVAQSYGF